MNNITSPATGDDAIEQEIKSKGLTAPRVTPDDIEKNIHGEYYFTAAQGVVGAHDRDANLIYHSALNQLTFCVLVLANGFTVVGESACASPENFDPELGKKIARGNAKEKCWPLMGYALRDRLSNPSTTEVSQ
jgi:hypothetical protein